MENKEAKEEKLEKADFGLNFQMGLLKLSLKRDHFCSQMVKYLGNDQDLKNFIIFDNTALHHMFILLVKGYNEYHTRPTKGQLEQMINDFPEKGKNTEPSRDEMREALDKIYSTDIHNEDYYKDHVENFIKNRKLL